MERLKNSSFSYLDQGNRFSCYTNGEQVVKISNQYFSKEKALNKVSELKAYYDLLHAYLGGYVANSTFSTREREDGLHAVQIDQPFVAGQNWQGVLRSMRNNYEYRFIIDFLQRCLSMREQTGHIPELYGPINRPDTMNQLTRTRNVKVIYKTDGYYPVLVDIGPNRFSATAYGTHFHNRLLGRSINEKLATSLKKEK